MDSNNLILNGWEKKRTIKHIINRHTSFNTTQIKYIFVLAGGLQPNGEVHEFVKLRLDKAIELYNQYIIIQPCKIIVMGGGTYHKSPILNEQNFVIHESTSCALYLTEHGEVNPTDIYREWSSYDTIANGYYAYLNYIQPLKIKNFVLITSKFHMPRAKVIFNYFNTIVFNAHIEFIETENYGIMEDVLNERHERESKSVQNFIKNIIEKKHSIAAFTTWFYEEHGAYKSIIYYQQNDKINKSY
jgi:vancomycin permeability regulator SanA